MASHRLRRRILALALAAALVTALSGCTADVCRERSLLGFFLCDASLVDDQAPPETRIRVQGRQLGPDDQYRFQYTERATLQADTVGADNPLYPRDYIAGERWEVVGYEADEGRVLFERSYPRGNSRLELDLRDYEPPGEEPTRLKVRLTVTDNQGATATATVRLKIERPTEPIASLDVRPNPARVGERVAFDASGSAAAVDGMTSTPIKIYRWSLRGTEEFHGAGYEPVTYETYGPEDVGTKRVGVRIVDEKNHTDEAWTTLEVLPANAPDPDPAQQSGQTPPRPYFTISPNPARLEQEVSFDASGSTGDITRYEWDLDEDGEYEEDHPYPTVTRSYTEVPGTDENVRVLLRATERDGDYGVYAATLRLDGSGEPRARVAATAAPARFTARLTVDRAHRRRGRGPLRVRGHLRGRLLSPGASGPLAALLARSSWKGRLAVRPGRTTSALVLARPKPRRLGSVCLRITLTAKRGERPTGTFRLLGGRGRLARLRGGGRFGFDLRTRGTAELAGLVRTRLGAARACSAPGRSR